MTKKTTSAEIKKMLKAGNLILGTERSIRSLKLGKADKILLSANCPKRVEKDVSHYAGLAGVEFQKLEYPNDELGVICKKPFSISVLAVVKGGK
ncbi:ribosomal L7Ae/L30e/S12e/Gadd45 family protein [Candidatus Woesearchaeota archaeon]|nr:ribosomal L7Ae/L30e/S12e/Gadd45 family protein [Candidatus Woesearchaeota archaeon]